jgi:hypothetical protein
VPIAIIEVFSMVGGNANSAVYVWEYVVAKMPRCCLITRPEELGAFQDLNARPRGSEEDESIQGISVHVLREKLASGSEVNPVLLPAPSGVVVYKYLMPPVRESFCEGKEGEFCPANTPSINIIGDDTRGGTAVAHEGNSQLVSLLSVDEVIGYSLA